MVLFLRSRKGFCYIPENESEQSVLGWNKSTGVINEGGRNDVDLDEFDESTCSGDRCYSMFYKEEEIITEGSTVWVNTSNAIWEERVI